MGRTNSGAAHRHPTSALSLDVSRLGRRPGTIRTVTETVPAPARIGLDLIAIPEGAPIELDMRLESVSEGVLVSGTATAPLTGECARCLSQFDDDITLDLTELFAYPGSITEATAEADEVGHVVDDRVDIEQTLVDAVGLALPLSPLCSPDCPGLCPQCGVALATAGPEHSHELIDPRWAKLAELKLPEKPEDSR